MRLGILYTGGTIGSVGDPLGPLSSSGFTDAFTEIVTPVLQSQFPDLTVGFISFGTTTLDSTNLQPADWCTMVNDILPAYGDYDAFLILHGTDTMAFTASALSFLFTGLQADGSPNAVLSKPVIITGSQVPLFYQENADDPLKLRFDTDAFQNVCGSVAAAHTAVPEVCLFFRNTLYRGNRTLKSNASQFDAFSAPNYPKLGQAGINFKLENENILHLPTTPGISLDSETGRSALAAQMQYVTANISGAKVMQLPAIPAPYTTATDTEPASSYLADLLTAVFAQGLNGIVLESYGEGNFPSGDPSEACKGKIYSVLAEADAAGVLIMDNTQVVAGIVDSNAYASGSWLAQVGATGAFDMTPIASYCKLVYLQTLRDYEGYSWSQADIKRLMQTNITGEVMDVNRLDSRGRLFLAPGESIRALDGSATMTNSASTGPTLTDDKGNVLWSALGDFIPFALPGRLYMQGDGNLVLYGSSNSFLWGTGVTFATDATSMLILEGASDPGGIRLYTYNYAQGSISKLLYPTS